MPTAPPVTRQPGTVWLGLLVLYVVWGSTYLAIAVAVQTIPPFLMAGARFGLAGAVLLAWSILRAGGAFVWPTRREWRDSAIVGGLLLGGGMGFVAWGEQTIPSGITALLIATMPVWITIFGRLFLGQRLPGLALVGIAIGFVGVAVLVGPTALGTTGALDPAGLIVVLLSPVSWALGSLYASHRATLPGQPLVATSAQMLTGAVVLGTMALVTGEPARLDIGAISGASMAAFLYLAIVGSLLAFTVFGWMLRVAPLPLVTTYAYVNPIVAVILGALILQEPIDARTVVAGAIIVLAVALIVTTRGRMAAPRGVSPQPGPSERPVAPRPSPSASD
jgi:drug/metabolite transporter (DMT)-like permease